MPSRINVNMLRLRFTIDCQPRTKNGQPPQSTTGEASPSEIHVTSRGANRLRTGSPGMNSLMASNSKGNVRAVLTQKRRFIPISSAFCSSPVTMRGSRVMPQIGQLPGASRIICGCIGHVYSIFSIAALTTDGSKAIPHFGHDPVLGSHTSGCMGQV